MGFNDLMACLRAENVMILSHERCASIPLRGDETVIRVLDPGKEFIPLNGNPVSVTQFHFEDDEVGPFVMSERQAELIIDIFAQTRDTDLVLIHCRAGQCRSASIGASLAVWRRNRALFDIITTSSHFALNIHVFSLLFDNMSKRVGIPEWASIGIVKSRWETNPLLSED